MKPLLELDHVAISYLTRSQKVTVVPDLSFVVKPGEALGLVGESGCGKSTIAFAIMDHLGRNGRLTGGCIRFKGQEISNIDREEFRQMRGREIAMVYQDPMSSLNPVMTIGKQLMEVPLIHKRMSNAEARAEALQMLEEVNFSDPNAVFDRYPYQLSGGQQQRVVISMALLGNPSLLLLDEPTTGLDVTVEASVLALVDRLRRKHGTSVIFISHNLRTVGLTCDRIGVMYAGELVEIGNVEQVLNSPAHPYTRGLLNAIPILGTAKRSGRLTPIAGHMPSLAERPAGCIFSPRCEFAAGKCTAGPINSSIFHEQYGHRVKCIRQHELPSWQRPVLARETSKKTKGGTTLLQASDLTKVYQLPVKFFREQSVAPTPALDHANLKASKGETLAIVGESGSGKSTFARILAGLEVATSGGLAIGDEEIANVPVEQRTQNQKRLLQMVFQNPDSTLNPSHSIGYALERALKRLKGLGVKDARAQALLLLSTVNLPPEYSTRKPRQLSGGQKQRVAIARALAGQPEMVIADEPVSALDVSVQASIINLLTEIQSRTEMTLIFISHDLAVIRYIADAVVVMYRGHVVEFGDVEDLYRPPYHPYTELLLGAGQGRTELDHAGQDGIGRIGGPQTPACPFSYRCPRKLGPICDIQTPPTQQTITGHQIVCHIPLAELSRCQVVPLNNTRAISRINSIVSGSTDKARLSNSESHDW